MRVGGAEATRFVGRKLELQLLADELAAAKAGHGNLCVLSGEAGIGKTRLLREFARKEWASGALFVQGRFRESGEADSGGVWNRVLNDCLQGSVTRSHQQTASDHESAKPSLLASPLAPLAASFTHTVESRAAQTESIVEKVTGLALRAAESLPLVIILDDIQNAGTESWHLLRVLGSELRNLRVLLLVAYRNEGSDDAAAARLSDWPGEHQQLGPLSPDETAQLVGQNLRAEPQFDLVDQVYCLTGGNPLLVREVASRLASKPRDSETWSTLSARAQSAIQSRLSRLSPAARRVLAVASLGEGDLNLATVASVSGLAPGETLAALGELVRARLVRAQIEPSRVRLSVEIVGQAAVADLLPGERFAIHRRIAEALEAIEGGEPGSRAGAIATHYLASLDSTVLSRAIAYARAAGTSAMRTRDFDEASQMFSLALRALDATEMARDVDLFETLISLAEAHDRGGNHLLAQQVLRRAAQIAEQLGDAVRLAEVVAILPRIEWPIAGEPTGLARMLSSRVAAQLEAVDAVSQGILESRLALTVSMPTGTEQQSDVASEAGRLEITHQRRDRPVLRRLHYHRNRLLARPDRLKERLEHGAELTKIALEIGDYRSVYLGHLARTIAFLNLGQIGLADAESELMLQAALLSREPAGRAMALSYRAGREIMEGRFASGERLLAEARGIGLGRDLSVLCDLCWPALVMPLDEQGRLGELEAVALASKDSASPDGSYAAMLSWLFLRLGRQHDAVFYLERAAGLVIESAQGGDGYLASLAALSEVAAATGDKSRAAELYRLLKPYAERNLVYGAIAVLGSAWRYLGILASTLGRPEEAIGHLERALEFNRRIGARPWALHAASELAGLLARSKRGAGQSRAVGLVGQVIEEAGALGMTKLAAHAIALRSRLTERSADTFAKAVGQPASPYGKNGFGKPHDAQDASRHAPENVQPLQGLQSVDSASKDTTREVESSFAEGSGSLFHREGDYWTLGYEGKVTRVGHRKGLTVIAYLLGHPGRELHALELCSVLDQDGGEVRGRRAPTNSAGAEEAMLDSRAKQSYRQRLRELREEIEEARSHNDGLRAERLEEESAYLTRELARALGIHGRDRKMNADVERARVRITSVIRAAIDHIGRHHRSLARYLMGSIRTGVYAEYRPIKESGPTWQL